MLIEGRFFRAACVRILCARKNAQNGRGVKLTAQMLVERHFLQGGRSRTLCARKNAQNGRGVKLTAHNALELVRAFVTSPGLKTN
jgi:hypothetical protein